ncbi:hypothetical protein BDN70DRAFT_821381, partial [Pholiota conissans]
SNIMRDTMLVNMSGREGHAMPIDLNIEHLIGFIKTLFSAKGLYSTWDRLSSISASVNYLQLIKKKVAESLNSGYQGSTHKKPDIKVLVFRIADRARELKLQEYVANRHVQSKPVLDLHCTGHHKFATTTLAIFNKKVAEYRLGHDFYDEEVDEIPRTDFAESQVDTNEEEIIVLEEKEE